MAAFFGPGQSQSADDFRRKGNELYKKAFTSDQFSSPGLRIGWAEEALRSYNKAKDIAANMRNSLEWLSCTKNIAMTEYNLAIMSGYRERMDSEMILYRFCSSLLHFEDVLKHGPGFQTQALKDYVVETFEPPARCGKLEKLITRSKLETFSAAQVRVFICEEITKEIVRKDEDGDWFRGASLLQEQDQAIGFAKASLAAVTYEAWLLLLQGAIDEICGNREFYFSRIQSNRSRCIAEGLLQETIANDEVINVDIVWDVVDLLHGAMRAASQFEHFRCLESEAKASGYLGYVCAKVLKLDEAAKLYLQNAITLAESHAHTAGEEFISSGGFYGEEWYQRARTELELIRKKQERFMASELQSQRAPMLAQLKPELDAINAVMSKYESKQYRAFELLKHIYKMHPPKESEHGLPDDLDKEDKGALKKIMLKTVKCYHPDRKLNKDHGMKWFVLCEEITKELNGLYVYFKD